MYNLNIRGINLAILLTEHIGKLMRNFKVGENIAKLNTSLLHKFVT